MRIRSLILASVVVALPALAQPTKPTGKPGPTGSATAKPGPSTVMPTAGPLGPAIDAVKKGDYAAAEKALAAVKSNDANVMLAKIQIDQGKYTEADKTIGTFANKGEGIPLKAKMLERTGKIADAIKLLDTNKSEKGRAGQWIRLLLGEYMIRVGRRADAETHLMSIVGDYNSDAIKDTDGEGMGLVGRATFLLRSFHDADKSLADAVSADPSNVQAFLWTADLGLDKYDAAKAESAMNRAGKVAPKNPDVLVTLAHVKMDQTMDFDECEKLADQALKINPKHTGAYAMKAGLALRDMDLVATDKNIADGLAINPNDLELLSLKAASKFLADDLPGYEAAKRDVLSKNGEYSQMYTIISEYAEWEHRYDDIVTMMKEAMKVDPKDVKAQAQLGIMQMRAGDDVAGLDNLQKVFPRDKYNVRVFNTLNLYEHNLATDYDLVTDGAFRIRYPKKTEPILQRYVPRLLGQAWASMKNRYGFVPVNPVQVEMFEDVPQRRGFIPDARTQFAVRTSGLPNIGIQGVCFGKVVAAMGPHSEPFNWGNVLWHELGHVFAIQLSKNHVPRWFTEGLSEYETIAQRPEWHRTLDPQLYKALLKNSLPAAVDMNRAFTHADDANDIIVAYYAASQMMVWTVETFGMNKVVDALKYWGQGMRTPDVIKKAFGVDAKDYDTKFRAWAMNRLSRYKGQYAFDPKNLSPDEAKDAAAKAPNDPDAHADYAFALLRAGDKDAAKKELETAFKLKPDHQTAHYLSMRIALSEKDAPGAEAHLKAIQKAGGDGYMISMLVANLAELKKDDAAARIAFENAWKYDPTQPEPLKGLYDLAKKEKRDADALEILRKLAPMDQHDGDVWGALLQGLVEGKQYAEAVKVGESAMFMTVGNPNSHLAYAKALEAQSDPERALFEAESTWLTSAVKPAEAAAAHSLSAKIYLAQKKTKEARQHRDEALKLDPESDAKALQIP